jgi:hypothetical protein
MEKLGSHRATAQCVPIRLNLAVLDAMALESAYRGATTGCEIVWSKTVADATSGPIDASYPMPFLASFNRLSCAASRFQVDVATP